MIEIKACNNISERSRVLLDRRRSADRIIMALRIIAVLSFVLLAMIAAAAGAYLADGDRQENRFFSRKQ